MATSTLTPEGQTYIPENIRKLLHLKPGDKLDFVVEDDGKVVLRPVAMEVSLLKGILKRKNARVVSIEEMNEAIVKGATGTTL